MNEAVLVSVVTASGAVIVAIITGLAAVLGGRRHDNTDSQLLDALTALAECQAREHVRSRQRRR